jgi:hypothetical protein
MRWKDLPADGAPGDAGASGLRRGEWEALRQRLERLPEGHPSALDDEEPEAEDQEADPAAESGGRSDADDSARQRPADREPGEAASQPRRGAAGASRARESDGRGAVAGARREPYRPWFASGEPAQPWFTGNE